MVNLTYSLKSEKLENFFSKYGERIPAVGEVDLEEFKIIVKDGILGRRLVFKPKKLLDSSKKLESKIDEGFICPILNLDESKLVLIDYKFTGHSDVEKEFYMALKKEFCVNIPCGN